MTAAVIIALAACTAQEQSSSGGKAPITYWRTLTGAAGLAQEEIAERFNATHEDTHVIVEFQGSYSDLAAKLMTAAVSRRGPHVTQLGTFEIRQFARAGVLVDLTPYLDGPNGIDRSGWPGTMADAGRIDGRVYWLPFNVTVPVLYYNPDIFHGAGISDPPETWDELFDHARRLTRRDANGRVISAGLAIWNITWPWISAIWSEGGELTDPDYTNITLDHPVAVELFTELQALVQSGAAILPDTASGGHRAAFIAGRAAMILDSPAPFDEIIAGATGFEPQTALYPAGSAGRVYAPGGGGLAMMTLTPEDTREHAWQFIRFMLEPDQIAYYAHRSGYMPFTPAAQRAAQTMGLSFGERRQIIIDALPYVRGDFSVTMAPPVRNAFDNAFRKILIDHADVAETLRTANESAKREMERER